MPRTSRPTEHLVSVPAAMSAAFAEIYGAAYPNWSVYSDPVGSQLGSAGGTVYLLVQAWKESGSESSFVDWLRSSKKLIFHGGGRSRRLPAYAPSGKPFIPIPVTRTAFGERLDQKLIDLQGERYRRLLENAPNTYCVMVTSGDVALDFDHPDGELPEGDVLCFGMEVDAEVATEFGVFVSDRSSSDRFLRMMQKPKLDDILTVASSGSFYIDTGMWLLSERAIMALLAKSGWDTAAERFLTGVPGYYDLYGDFGLALGEEPTAPDPVVGKLASALYPLANPSFLHLGSSRQLIESVSSMQAKSALKSRASHISRHPDIYIQNSRFDPPIHRSANTMLWIENSSIPHTWQIAREHVLTGIPANSWTLKLEQGVSIDFVPIGETAYAVRVYGFDDLWSGRITSPETTWQGRPALRWFSDRQLTFDSAGIEPNTDIHDALLHPVLELDAISGEFLSWMFQAHPERNSGFVTTWVNARRLSSQDLNRKANLVRQQDSRINNLREIAPLLQRNAQSSVFYRVDLAATAELLYNDNSATTFVLPSEPPEGDNPLLRSKALIYQAELLRRRSSANLEQSSELAAKLQSEAFTHMRQRLMDNPSLPVKPTLDIQEDQIVWGRSPIRLDIAGGWLDTPPYCIEHGGRVINIAVDLNGQPPIHVYAKLSKKHEIVVRSIDLGVEQRFLRYEDLGSYAEPGSEFALAKAALALAGFLPEFQSGSPYESLTDQLRDFGGGIEISMMVAIPAGSGLGTSSILAATLLGTLSNLCRLNWTRSEIVQRALVLEQMLTTGGGWQDQVGGVYGGLKLAETYPGIKQDPIVRWLPDTLFSSGANSRILLYYTGITRMAKNILQDIARDMFLNRAGTMACLADIDSNVDRANNAIQLGDYDELRRSTELTWEYTQRLAAETNPLTVKGVFESLAGEDVVGRFLGAGGGGYLLLLAADSAAGARVREKLLANPLNPRARFVDISTSHQGLEVTRS